MDGTLVDSTAGVTAAWEALVKEYPGKGLNVEDILSCELFSWDLSLPAPYNHMTSSIPWHPDYRKPS